MRNGRLFIFFLLLTCQIEAKNETYRVILEPRFQTKISSEVTTTVKAVHKKMGDSFAKDEPLVELDELLFKYNYNKAQAIKENAETNLNTYQELFDEQSASRTQLSEAKAAFSVAQTEMALAEKALHACLIKAPYAGKVQEVFVEEFERIEAGKELISLIDDTVLIAKLLVDAELLSEIKVGKMLSVEIPLIGRGFNAVITQIAAGVNPASGLIKVDAQVDNTSGVLRAGMVGIVRIGKREPVRSEVNSLQELPLPLSPAVPEKTP